MCWFIGILTFMVNFISILIHIKLFSQLHTNKFFPFGLSLVDYLFGIYLLTISSANSFYGRSYVGLEYTSKQHFACKVSSLCSLAYLIASPIMLFVMVFARFCVIKWPMNSKFKCEIFNRRITFTIIMTIVGCCFIVFFTLTEGLGHHISNYMSFITNKSKTNRIHFIHFFNNYLCSTILPNYKYNSKFIDNFGINQNKSSSVSSSKVGKYNQIIIHLLIVIFSNMCCWIPSTVVFILPLAGYQVSNHILVLVITIVVPINCIVDPIIF